MRLQEQYNVALYLRLSRDDNNGNVESMSISNQRDLLKEYVNERGWSVADIYIDDGYSGTTFDRPDFKRMLADIELGRINCVITKDLSRFGRNYAQVGYYTEEYFIERSVRYIAINDSVDTMKEDNDIAPFKNIINEWYAKDVSRKVKSVRRVSAKQGKFMGSKSPYGYIKSSANKHLLIVDDKAADVVKMIYSMYIQGYTKREIVSKLNQQRIPSPRAYYYQSMGCENPNPNESATWNVCTIAQLMANPVYRGDMVQGRRRVLSYKTKKRAVVPQEDWIVIENTHEAIVDRDTWIKTQSVDKRVKRARTKKDYEINLFGGIIRCADCGAAMAYSTRTQHGKTAHFYRCSRYNTHGKEICQSHRIDAELLTQIVLVDIRYHAALLQEDEDKLIGKLSMLQRSDRKNEIENAKVTFIKAKARIKEIDLLAKRLFEEKFVGNVPEDMFKSMMQGYNEEKSNLAIKIKNVETDLIEIESNESDIMNWVQMIKGFVEINALDRETVLSLIDCIEIHDKQVVDGEKAQKVIIRYKFVGQLTEAFAA